MSSTVADKLAKKSSRRPSSKQVRLKLVYIDFWSAVKLSFLAGVVLAVIAIVGTFLVWMILNQFGIFGKVDELFKSVADSGADLAGFIGLPQVMGFAFVVAIVDVVVTTALGAVFAALYNMAVKISGGLLVGFTNN